VSGTINARRKSAGYHLPTEAKWLGATYPEDKTVVTEGIKNLIKEGIYPECLFEDSSLLQAPFKIFKPENSQQLRAKIILTIIKSSSDTMMQ